MCAKADDPLTINQNFRALNIGVAAADGSGLQGLVIFHFLGYTTSHSASRVSGIVCEEAWEALDNVDDVDCLSEPFAGGAIYNVTFKQWPIEPMENNFFSHTGNPGLTNFTCDVSGASSTSGAPVECNITNLVSDDVTEYEYCGRRGQCDFTSGTCYCIDGYEGSTCTASSYAESGSNTLPGVDIHAAGNDYVGDLFKLSTDKSSASDFTFMKIIADDEDLLSIRGDGLLSIAQIDVTTYGATVSAGGLTILTDGAKIEDGGLQVSSTALDDPVLHIVGDGESFTDALLRVDSVRSEDANYWFARFNTAYDVTDGSYDVNVFSIRGDGYTKIEGELHVNNVTSVHSLELTGAGFTINQGGLHIIEDGATIYDGGAEIRNNNLTVLRAYHNDAFRDKDNGTVFSVESSADFTRDINLIEAIMDADSAYTPETVFRVNGLPRTYIDQGGLDVIGGITVSSAGINITAGGLWVSSGGVHVQGGNLIIDNDVVAEGTIITAGLTSTASFTIAAGSMTASAGTLTVAGITSTGAITGTSSLATAGLTTSGSITISAGSITASSGTLSVAGITSSNAITAQTTFSAAGLTSTSSLTVSAGSLTASSGTLTVAGMSSAQAITGTTTLYAAGMESTAAVTAATTIYGAGIHSSAAMTAATTIYGAGIHSSAAVTAATTMYAAGVASSASLTVSAGSLTASSGTLTVAGMSSAQAITGTTTLYAAGMESTAAVTAATTIYGAGIHSSAAVTGTSTLFVAGMESTAAITAATSVYAASVTSNGVVSATSFSTTSDVRYKTNVTSLQARANRLLELKGVSFRWRDETHFDNETHFGFIAQEVEDVFPEIVRENTQGMRSLQVDAVGPLLVEALRLLQHRVMSLENMLESTMLTLGDISARVSQLELQIR